MSYPVFHIVHLTFVFLLVAVTFAAFAAPLPERRRTILIWSGVSSLMVFLSGFGLLGIMKAGLPIWSLVKVICWLFISAAAGIVFRLPAKEKLLTTLSFVAIFLAVCMVSLKPF